MKKIFILISIFTLITLSACNKKAPTLGTAQRNITPTTSTALKLKTTTSAISYKDGVYTAFGNKWAYGKEGAKITIKNGKIVNVYLSRIDTTGKEVNYNDWVGQKEANGSIKPNLKKFRLDMAKRIISKQSYQVDTISTATVSTTGWKLATQRALEKAK